MLALGQRGEIPPAFLNRLDQGAAVTTCSGHHRRKQPYQGDEPVINRPLAVEPSRQECRPAGGIYQRGRIPRIWYCINQGIHSPFGLVMSHADDRPGPHHELRPGLSGSVGKHAIEAAAVDMPARAIGVNDEIIVIKLRLTPGNCNPWRLAVAVFDESVPYAEFGQRLFRFGR
jgi:hypothetical protein